MATLMLINQKKKMRKLNQISWHNLGPTTGCIYFMRASKGIKLVTYNLRPMSRWFHPQNHELNVSGTECVPTNGVSSLHNSVPFGSESFNKHNIEDK